MSSQRPGSGQSNNDAITIDDSSSSHDEEEPHGLEEEEEEEDSNLPLSLAGDDEEEEEFEEGYNEEDEEATEEEEEASVKGTKPPSVVEILDSDEGEEEDAAPAPAPAKPFDASFDYSRDDFRSSKVGPAPTAPPPAFGFGTQSQSQQAATPKVPAPAAPAFGFASATGGLYDDLENEPEQPTEAEAPRVRQSEDLAGPTASGFGGLSPAPSTKQQGKSQDADAELSMWDTPAPSTQTDPAVGQKRQRDLVVLSTEDQRENKARRLEVQGAQATIGGGTLPSARQPVRAAVATSELGVNTVPERLMNHLSPETMSTLNKLCGNSAGAGGSGGSVPPAILEALTSLSRALKVDLTPSDDALQTAADSAKQLAIGRRAEAAQATFDSMSSFNASVVQDNTVLQSKVGNLEQELQRAKRLASNATTDRDISVKQLADEKAAHRREVEHLKAVQSSARSNATGSVSTTKAATHQLEAGRHSSICDPQTPGSKKRGQQSTFLPAGNDDDEDEESETGSAAKGEVVEEAARETSGVESYFSKDNKKNRAIADALLPLHDEVLAVAATEGCPYDARTMLPESGSGSHARKVFQKVYGELLRARGLVKEHRQQQSKEWKQRFSGDTANASLNATMTSAAGGGGVGVLAIPPPQRVVFESVELQQAVKKLEADKKMLELKLEAEEAKVKELTKRCAALPSNSAPTTTSVMALGTLQGPMVKAQVAETLLGVLSIDPQLETRVGSLTTSNGTNETVDVKVSLGQGKSFTARCPIPVKSVIGELQSQPLLATVVSSEGLAGLGVGKTVRELMAHLYAPPPVLTPPPQTQINQQQQQPQTPILEAPVPKVAEEDDAQDAQPTRALIPAPLDAAMLEIPQEEEKAEVETEVTTENLLATEEGAPAPAAVVAAENEEEDDAEPQSFYDLVGDNGLDEEGDEPNGPGGEELEAAASVAAQDGPSSSRHSEAQSDNAGDGEEDEMPPPATSGSTEEEDPELDAQPQDQTTLCEKNDDENVKEKNTMDAAAGEEEKEKGDEDLDIPEDNEEADDTPTAEAAASPKPAVWVTAETPFRAPEPKTIGEGEPAKRDVMGGATPAVTTKVDGGGASQSSGGFGSAFGTSNVASASIKSPAASATSAPAASTASPSPFGFGLSSGAKPGPTSGAGGFSSGLSFDKGQKPKTATPTSANPPGAGAFGFGVPAASAPAKTEPKQAQSSPFGTGFGSGFGSGGGSKPPPPVKPATPTSSFGGASSPFGTTQPKSGGFGFGAKKPIDEKKTPEEKASSKKDEEEDEEGEEVSEFTEGW